MALNWTQEQLDEVFEHLAYLSESMERMTQDITGAKHGLRTCVAEINQSMDRVQAIFDQITSTLASMISDLERANAKSN